MVAIPYAVGFALATLLSGVVTWRAMQARPRQGARWLAVAMGGVTWWSAMKLCEVLVDDVERIQMVFNALHWIGVGVVSIGVLGLGISLRGRGEVLTPTRIAALSIIPALSVIAWLGDPRVVDLLVTSTPMPAAVIGALEAVEATWPWFQWVSRFYLWGLVTIGSVFIVETALDRPKMDPSRLLLGIMVAVPWMVSLPYEFGMMQWAEFDITVFGFVVTGVAGIATIDRFRLFDVPFARSQIVEEFSTPVLVYGQNSQLYDYNKQAATVLDIAPADLDDDIREVLADTALPISDQRAEHDGDLADELDGTQVWLPAEESDSDGRYYQIQISTLGTGAPSALGYTIQLIDITDQHRQYEETKRERDLKELVRSTLVQLSSRDEIEQAFCNQLAAGDRYSLVWIGEYSTENELVLKTVASGETIEADLDQYEPATMIMERGLEALETGDVTVIHGAATPETATIREALTDTEIQGVALIPLTHNELSYGVLTVYTSRPDAFDSAERQLLADLGESIGFAINAIEQREALQGNQVREVRLEITDPDHYLVSLADTPCFKETDATIEVYEIRDESISGSGSETASATEDHILHFLTVRGVQTEPVIDHLTTHPDIQSVTRLRDNGAVSALRVLVCPPSIGSLLAEAGGGIQTIRVGDGTVQAVAEFSPRADMNQMVEHVRAAYPETWIQSLVMKNPEETRPDPSPVASLTAKQRQALEAAYRSGFFDRPQRQTADEIASTLGVSRSTFLKHLRTAEQILFADLLPNADQASDETS